MRETGRGAHATQGDLSTPSKEDLRSIIQSDDAETLVRWADRLGRELARNLSTSQIRGIFGTIRKIEMNWREEGDEARQMRARRDLLLLKPKLAYQAKKERGRGVKEFANVLLPAIDMVENDTENFHRFVDFVEAILAYHKAYDGK